MHRYVASGKKAASRSKQGRKKRAKSKRDMESDYQDAGEDSLAEHLEAVPPVVGGLVVCGYTTT